MTYPDDSVQSLVAEGRWWEATEEKEPSRGSLIFAFAPHVDQVPYTIKEVARAKAKEHNTGIIDIAPLEMKRPRRREDLPVAAMSLAANELWLAYRGKKRPCLVLGSTHPEVDNDLRRNMPKRSTDQVVLVAPYYGVDQDGSRAGYNPALVERIRHAEYARFFWDKLPISGKPEESILRLDHIQPIGTKQNSYELAGFRLSDRAMPVIDDWISWLVWGGVSPESPLNEYRKIIVDSFGY